MTELALPRTSVFSPRRVGAIVARYVYLLRRSPIRLIELIYWPFMNLLMWGFITLYLRGPTVGMAQAAGLFLGAVVLWEILIRSNLGVTITFIEELYSRNLGHLFISPLRPYELVAACMATSLLRTLIGVAPSALLIVPMFGFSIFGLGLPLIAFYVTLSIFGWAFGIVIMAILIRWGLAAEGFAWAAMFIIMPIAGVYYPISALPHWLQPVAWALPSAYVFEGMRAIVLHGVVRGDYLLIGFGLDLVYLALGAALFQWMFRVARVRGLLLNTG
jgi:ABC-2 type transport system permease protein